MGLGGGGRGGGWGGVTGGTERGHSSLVLANCSPPETKRQDVRVVPRPARALDTAD